MDDEEVTTRHIVDLEDLFKIVTTEMTGRSGGRPGETGLLGRGLRWSILGVHFHAPTLQEMRHRYSDLSPDQSHLDVPIQRGIHPCASWGQSSRSASGSSEFP